MAAHLHVLLRRRTGRVTDTEWMAVNREYAQAMIRFAQTRAAEDNAPELAEWAQRLERAWAAPVDQARQTFMESAMRTVSLRAAPPDTGANQAPTGPAAAGGGSKPGDPSGPGGSGGPGGPPPAGGGSRYIGGLR